MEGTFPQHKFTFKNGCVPATQSSYVSSCLQQFVEADADLVSGSASWGSRFSGCAAQSLPILKGGTFGISVLHSLRNSYSYQPYPGAA
jgi:hypothetical protein